MSMLLRGFVLAVLPFVSVALHGQEPVAWKATSEFEVNTKGSAGGLAWDGKSLWVSAQSVFHADKLLKYSREGRLERTVEIHNGGNLGGGLTYLNGSLYVLDYSNRIATNNGINFTGGGAIHVLNANDTLKPVIKLPADQHNTFGFAHTKNGLIYGHSPIVAPRGTIFVTDIQGMVKSKSEVAFYICGMTHDGNNLWISSTKSVLRLNDKWEVAATFIPPKPLADLTWDGTSIWGVVRNENKVQQFKIADEN